MNKTPCSRNFLFAAREDGGQMPPMLSAARRAVQRGHRVRIMSDRCNRAEIEAIGAEYVSYSRAPNRLDKSAESDVVRDWAASSVQGQIACLQNNIMCGPALAYARDVIEEIQRRRPDLLICSDLLIGPMLAAEVEGVPYAILAPNLCIHPVPGIPPFGPGFLPAAGDEEKQRDAQVAEANRQLMNSGLPAVNEARRQLGLPPLSELREQYVKAERYWLATSRAFDFPASALPPNLRYVGPELDDPVDAAPWNPPWDASDSRPLILVSFSTTFQNHGRRIPAAFQRLGVL